MNISTLIFATTTALFLSFTTPGYASSDILLPFSENAQVANEQPEGPIILNRQARIIGETIVLGDLFTNVGNKAGKAVAYAPKPGRKTMYDAKWLYRVAKYFKLDWKPSSALERVVVIRDSITIGHDEIINAIMASLADQNLSPDMLAELSNRSIKLYLPADGFADFGVEDLRYDKRTQRFSAVIVAPIDHPAAQRHRVTGKLFKMVDVPILSRNVLSGDIISMNDLEWQRMPSEKVSRNTITSLGDIIGMTPRRSLRAGQPIRKAEIESPVLVKKKTLVTIIVENKYMTLTARGRAMQNGALGDVIRITNLQSNTVIDAEVVGPGRLVVRSTSQMAMN